MIRVNEVIVVEGRDDVINLKQYVEAEFIITHGYGIKEETFRRIEVAQKRKGVIIFTDPDFAGEKIRSRIENRIPEAKHAFVPREEALRKGDIGVENASEAAIIKALEKVRSKVKVARDEFSQKDMMTNGLIGHPDAATRRDQLGAYLGIGYGNAKQFLSRLNGYGITRQEFQLGLKEIDHE